MKDFMPCTYVMCASRLMYKRVYHLDDIKSIMVKKKKVRVGGWCILLYNYTLCLINTEQIEKRAKAEALHRRTLTFSLQSPCQISSI